MFVHRTTNASFRAKCTLLQIYSVQFRVRWDGWNVQHFQGFCLCLSNLLWETTIESKCGCVLNSGSSMGVAGLKTTVLLQSLKKCQQHLTNRALLCGECESEERHWDNKSSLQMATVLGWAWWDAGWQSYRCDFIRDIRLHDPDHPASAPLSH